MGGRASRILAIAELLLKQFQCATIIIYHRSTKTLQIADKTLILFLLHLLLLNSL